MLWLLPVLFDAQANVQTEGATALPDFFYPVAQSRLLKNQPLARAIGGRRIVVFRDGAGQARALDARCPHRGANLADGHVKDGCLACPYHGWRFAGDGRCVHVPSQPEKPMPARSTAHSFDVVEQQGLIWVRLSERHRPAAAPPPTFAIAEDPSYRSFAIEGIYPGPADWWMENFMDISHVPFVHRSTFGGHKSEVTPGPVLRRPDERGYKASVKVRYEYGVLARLIHGAVRSYTEEVFFDISIPATIHLVNDMGGGRRQAIAFFATPEDAMSTRVILIVWRNYLKWLPGADAIGASFTRRVLAEDRTIALRSITALPLAERAVAAADGPTQELCRLLRLWRDRETAPAHEKKEYAAHEG